MKYLKIFEEYNRITPDQIAKCISSGGVIYAKIINDYPNSDPEEALEPTSVDEDGLVTVNIEGADYEVELDNISKIKYGGQIDESLNMSTSFNNILRGLLQKRNKVAWFLIDLTEGDAYNSDEVLNLISIANTDNTISYLQKNRRTNDYEENYLTTARTTIRVGRAVRKIYDTIKPFLKIKGKAKARVFKETSEKDIYIVDILQDIDGYKNITPYTLNDRECDDGFMMTTPSKLKVKGEDLDFEGEVVELQDFWGEFKSVVIKLTEDINVSTIQNRYSYGRRGETFDVDIEYSCEFKLTDSDIEEFVNEYISILKMSRADEDSKIEEVKGDEIAKWYSSENYQSNIGKLGSSCMSHDACQNYFDIYTKNPEVVSLLILKNKSNKLVARALLWKTDNNGYFMDRVYSLNDFDNNYFINYAIQNDYIYRTQKTVDFEYYKGNNKIDTPHLEVTIREDNIDYYPFVDTLCYLYKNNLSNEKKLRAITLTDTNGKWKEYHNF